MWLLSARAPALSANSARAGRAGARRSTPFDDFAASLYQAAKDVCASSVGASETSSVPNQERDQRLLRLADHLGMDMSLEALNGVVLSQCARRPLQTLLSCRLCAMTIRCRTRSDHCHAEPPARCWAAHPRMCGGGS